MTKFFSNLKYTLKRWARIPHNVILCLRFPFLYPHSRFDDNIHFRWYWLEQKIEKLKNVSYFSKSHTVIGTEYKKPVKFSKNCIETNSDTVFIENNESLAYQIKNKGCKNKKLRIFSAIHKNNTGFELVVIPEYSKILKSQRFIYNYQDYVKEDIKPEDFCKFNVYWRKQEFFNNKSHFADRINLVIEIPEGYTRRFDNIADKQCTDVIVCKFKYRLYRILDSFYRQPLQYIMFLPTSTELDAMPDGWRKAFGIRMCGEIKKALLDAGGPDLLYSYRILQIKEKYGELRWYDAYAPDCVFDIISKYACISAKTCINCGKKATKLSTGWVSPYCDECFGDGDDYIEIK